MVLDMVVEYMVEGADRWDMELDDKVICLDYLWVVYRITGLMEQLSCYCIGSWERVYSSDTRRISLATAEGARILS